MKKNALRGSTLLAVLSMFACDPQFGEQESSGEGGEASGMDDDGNTSQDPGDDGNTSMDPGEDSGMDPGDEGGDGCPCDEPPPPPPCDDSGEPPPDDCMLQYAECLQYATDPAECDEILLWCYPPPP